MLMKGEMVEISVEQAEQIKKIRNRVETGLSMSRVPRDTKEAFIAIADIEFCSDYGMLLKTLLDSYIKGGQLEILSNKLLDHENRLNRLEGTQEPKKKITITTLSGKKIEKVEQEDKKNE